MSIMHYIGFDIHKKIIRVLGSYYSKMPKKCNMPYCFTLRMYYMLRTGVVRAQYHHQLL